MAIALVGSASRVTINGSSTSALTITRTATGGNALVATGSAWRSGSFTLSSVSDGGNTWTALSAIADRSGGSRNLALLGASVNITGGSRSVSFNLSAAGVTYAEIGLSEFSGVATASAVDTSSTNANINTSGSTDASAGAITTTNAGDLLYGVAGVNAVVSTLGFGSPTSWTNVYRWSDASTTTGYDAGYWLPGSIQTSYNAQWSHSNNASDVSSACIIALKPAGGGGGPTYVERVGTISVAVTSSVPKTVVKARANVASMAATFVANAARLLARTGTMSMSATLSGQRARVVARHGSVAAAASLIGASAKVLSRTGTISASAALSALAARIQSRVAAISATATLSAVNGNIAGRVGTIDASATFNDPFSAPGNAAVEWGLLPQGPVYSYVTYSGTGVQTDFAVPFPYLSQGHVEASVAAASAGFTWVNPGTIRISPAPANGATVLIRRNSNRGSRLVDFADGATLTEADLDRDSTQLLFIAQEAIDQVTIGYAFSTDANGSRVMNVGAPVNANDAATRGWVEEYVASLVEGDGVDILPLDNEWTGDNTFTKPVTIGSAVLDPAEAATKEWLTVNKALNVIYTSTSAITPAYGFVGRVSRTSGVGDVIGGQFLAMNLSGNSARAFGFGGEAWKSKTSTGFACGMQVGVVNLNPSDDASERVGLNVEFKNRDVGQTGGGSSPSTGDAGLGTGANKYNTNSSAVWISAQGRSDSGATYVGWGRGFRFRDNWADVSKLPAYNAGKAYVPGDYFTHGGLAYQVLENCTGIAPPNVVYYSAIATGTELGAIGIDLSGTSQQTAERVRAGIKLRGQMPIFWDTEERIETAFDPATSMWRLKNRNNATPLVEVNVITRDVFVNGTPRIIATRAAFSVHRGMSGMFTNPGVFTPVACGTKDFDYRNEYNTSTGRYTPTVSGDFHFIAQMETEDSAPAGDLVNVAIYKNGVVYKASSQRLVAGVNTIQVSATVPLNGTTDYVDMRVLGTDFIAMSGEPTATFFQGYKLP